MNWLGTRSVWPASSGPSSGFNARQLLKSELTIRKDHKGHKDGTLKIEIFSLRSGRGRMVLLRSFKGFGRAQTGSFFAFYAFFRGYSIRIVSNGICASSIRVNL